MKNRYNKMVIGKLVLSIFIVLPQGSWSSVESILVEKHLDHYNEYNVEEHDNIDDNVAHNHSHRHGENEEEHNHEHEHTMISFVDIQFVAQSFLFTLPESEISSDQNFLDESLILSDYISKLFRPPIS